MVDIDIARKYIREFLVDEYDHDVKDISDKDTYYNLAYTETDNGKAVQVDVDLNRRAMVFSLDNKVVATTIYPTLKALIENDLSSLEFSELVSRKIDLETGDLW
jgi:hypothetical protein